MFTNSIPRVLLPRPRIIPRIQLRRRCRTILLPPHIILPDPRQNLLDLIHSMPLAGDAEDVIELLQTHERETFSSERSSRSLPHEEKYQNESDHVQARKDAEQSPVTHVNCDDRNEKSKQAQSEEVAEYCEGHADNPILEWENLC